MITASYGDKIVKQSCYFAIICNGEINKKHMGVTLFHYSKFLEIMCEDETDGCSERSLDIFYRWLEKRPLHL